jgi:hypothetical protein
MLSWCHSDFHVYIGDRITLSDKSGLGNLARYIIKACFSKERMVYAMSSKESRQNWAMLIQKIYEVDPLRCPKCQCTVRIIVFIEELDDIEKILRHLDRWERPEQ